MKDYEKDPQYKAYIEVVYTCSGSFALGAVQEAMAQYANQFDITASGIKSIARAIVAGNSDMMVLAIHRWRTASGNFSQADHDASLEWRAQYDPVYIKEHAK